MEERFFQNGFHPGIVNGFLAGERAKRDFLHRKLPGFGKHQGRRFYARPDLQIFFQWEKDFREALDIVFLEHIEAAHILFIVALPRARF